MTPTCANMAFEPFLRGGRKRAKPCFCKNLNEALIIRGGGVRIRRPSRIRGPFLAEQGLPVGPFARGFHALLSSFVDSQPHVCRKEVLFRDFDEPTTTTDRSSPALEERVAENAPRLSKSRKKKFFAANESGPSAFSRAFSAARSSKSSSVGWRWRVC